MATCDVRDELIEHVKQVQRKHVVPAQPQATQTPAVSPTSTAVLKKASIVLPQAKKPQSDLDQPEMKTIHTVELSNEMIKQAAAQEERYHAGKQQRWKPSLKNWQVLAIHAALLMAKQSRDTTRDARERQLYRCQVSKLHQVLQQRQQLRPLVEIEAVSRSRVVVRISVPV